MEDMGSSHSENDESDIEKRYSTIMKRSKAGGKQKSSKIQKMDDNKSETCLFRKQSPGVVLQIHRKTPVPESCNFIKKETLIQVLSCEFCNIFKNTAFFYRTLPVAASAFFTSPSPSITF